MSEMLKTLTACLAGTIIGLYIALSSACVFWIDCPGLLFPDGDGAIVEAQPSPAAPAPTPETVAVASPVAPAATPAKDIETDGARGGTGGLPDPLADEGPVETPPDIPTPGPPPRIYPVTFKNPDADALPAREDIPNITWEARADHEAEGQYAFFTDCGLYRGNTDELTGALCLYEDGEWRLRRPRLEPKDNLIENGWYSLFTNGNLDNRRVILYDNNKEVVASVQSVLSDNCGDGPYLQYASKNHYSTMRILLKPCVAKKNIYLITVIYECFIDNIDSKGVVFKVVNQRQNNFYSKNPIFINSKTNKKHFREELVVGPYISEDLMLDSKIYNKGSLKLRRIDCIRGVLHF